MSAPLRGRGQLADNAVEGVLARRLHYEGEFSFRYRPFRFANKAYCAENRKRLKAQSDIRKLATLGRFLVAHEGPVPEGAAADQQEGKGAVFDPALATLDAETSYSMDTNEK